MPSLPHLPPHGMFLCGLKSNTGFTLVSLTYLPPLPICTQTLHTLNAARGSQSGVCKVWDAPHTFARMASDGAEFMTASMRLIGIGS